jgi:hypothetical protein
MGIRDRRSSGLDPGVAGASARREGERRKTNRERRVREKHPRLGGALLALTGEPGHERGWAYGAAGEELVAKELEKRLPEDAVLLHDRRVPGNRANIDRIVVAASGVWVIDTKRYRGKVAVVRPLFGDAKLTIAGRNKSGIVAGLRKQVALVDAAMKSIDPAVPVHGAICFVDAQLPLLGTIRFGGFRMLHPRGLVRHIGRSGPLPASELATVAGELAARFPAA